MPATHKPITIPSIGQDVFYSPSLQEASETGYNIWAAKVTALRDGKKINACVFLPSGHIRARYGIPIFYTMGDAKENGRMGDYCFIAKQAEEFFDKLVCEKA